MSFPRIIMAATVGALAVACAERDVPSGTVTVSDEIQTSTSSSTAMPGPAPAELAAPAVVAAAPVALEPAPEPAPTAAAPSADTVGPAYTVTCTAEAAAAEQCVVDKTTYVGWRTFAGQCQVCHGGSALGSTFAPNLLGRFHERVDYPRFVEVVLKGYRGQVGMMPAWQGNPNVEPHIDAMYAYLKARADGVLPPGRPARAP